MPTNIQRQMQSSYSYPYSYSYSYSYNTTLNTHNHAHTGTHTNTPQSEDTATREEHSPDDVPDDESALDGLEGSDAVNGVMAAYLKLVHQRLALEINPRKAGSLPAFEGESPPLHLATITVHCRLPVAITTASQPATTDAA